MPMRSSGFAPDEHSDTEAGAAGESKRVGIVHEHDLLRRGIASCLAEDPALVVVFAVAEEPPAESIDVAVVSSRALAATSFDVPVVLFRDTAAQGPVIQRETVFATLSLPQLTAEQLVASVRAAAVRLRVSEQDVQRAARSRRASASRSVDAGTSGTPSSSGTSGTISALSLSRACQRSTCRCSISSIRSRIAFAAARSSLRSSRSRPSAQL